MAGFLIITRRKFKIFFCPRDSSLFVYSLIGKFVRFSFAFALTVMLLYPNQTTTPTTTTTTTTTAIAAAAAAENARQ